MDYNVIICFYFALFISINCKSVRIIGGEETSIEEYPFIVQILRLENVHICAGVIISNRHVLTAAHCVHKKHKFYELFRVYAGRSNLNEVTTSIYSIKKYYTHPGFEGEVAGKKSIHCDIALLILNEEIAFNNKQNKIDLPTQNFVAQTKVIILGWGVTSYPNGRHSNQLKKAIVEIMDFDDCKFIFPYPIRGDHLCTLGEDVRASNGDSGGPVIHNGKVIGLISFSIPWFINLPQIQTNVYTHLPFIRHIIEEIS